MNKTHWKRLINPDYIGAYSLTPGEDMIVVIQSVGCEKVTGTGGKKDECSVARLVNQKPFILNATNSKTIAKLYGPYIEDWAGKPIILYASTTNLAGEPVECLRVRPVQPSQIRAGKPSLTAERFANALAKVSANEYSWEKLANDFALTDQQREDLHAVVDKIAEQEPTKC